MFAFSDLFGISQPNNACPFVSAVHPTSVKKNDGQTKVPSIIVRKTVFCRGSK